ncbi:MAG: phage portal protein [Planctomycetota bacterium]
MPFQAFERALSRIAPGVALERAKNRRAFRKLDGSRHGLGFSTGSAYEAAGRGRRTQGWRTRQDDANAALDGALTLIRGRSRDLCRNNPWVVSGVGALEDFTVGTGLEVSPQGTGPLVDTVAELWRQWSKSTRLDADGMDDLAGIQALVWRTVIESGSALIRRRIRQEEDAQGMRVPLQLQVLEPDHLDLSKQVGENGNRVIHGVEVDGIGRRVAYWLYPEHPGNSNPRSMQTSSKRVPASEILHVFRRTRPGEMQAAPWLHSVIVRTRTLDEFEDAELLRMVVASSWAGFVTSSEDPDEGTDDERAPYPLEEIEPGIIEYLRPGESIEFPQLPQVSGRDGYVATQLRAIAAGLRVPYEALTHDLTKVNFSSGRMGFNAFHRRTETWRRRILWLQLLGPVWQWFLEAAVAQVALPAEALEIGADWTPPATLVLDPEKEGKADAAAIRNGTKTLSEVLRGRGRDPREHLEQAARDFALLDELGLVFDSDPRRVVAPGSVAVEADSGGSTS